MIKTIQVSFASLTTASTAVALRCARAICRRGSMPKFWYVARQIAVLMRTRSVEQVN